MATTDTVDITGVDKKVLLEELVKSSKCARFFGDYSPPLDINSAIAEAIANNWRFDYLQGRVMKCDISGDTVNVWGYDRDNGQGAFQLCVNKVKGMV